jgi:hypothetical protein
MTGSYNFYLMQDLQDPMCPNAPSALGAGHARPPCHKVKFLQVSVPLKRERERESTIHSESDLTQSVPQENTTSSHLSPSPNIQTLEL